MTALGELAPGAFSVSVSASFVAQMKDAFRILSVKVEGKDLSAEDQKNLEAVVQKITAALEHGHYAEFGHLLLSAPIRNAERVAKE